MKRLSCFILVTVLVLDGCSSTKKEPASQTESFTLVITVIGQQNIESSGGESISTPVSSVPNSASIGNRIDITRLMSDRGFVHGDITYDDLEGGYQSDQSHGTEFDAVMTNGEYKIVYKGTDIEPMMTVIKSVTAYTIDLNADSSHTAGWQVFHLTDAQNTATPFPNITWLGGGNLGAGEYGYTILDGGVGGYAGNPYDANAGTGIADLGSGKKIWSNAGPTKYFCIRKLIQLNGSMVLENVPGQNISGEVDDDVAIYLRNSQEQVTPVFSDGMPGAGNFSGSINFDSLRSGENWLEVYATSGVFSGNNSYRSFYMNIQPFTIYTTSLATRNRYRVDSSGNIYDDFGLSGWSDYWQTHFGREQNSNPNRTIDGLRDGSSADDGFLYDYVVPDNLSDKIGEIASPYGDWLTYTNQNHGFELEYPPDSQISDQTESSVHIQLSFAPDTNLGEKYLDISVAENVNPCSSPQAQGYPPGAIQSSQMTINSLSFTLESGADAGAGNIYEWTAYLIAKGSDCVSMTFLLHSSNPAMYETPPFLFDSNAESTVFAEIVSTFRWLSP